MTDVQLGGIDPSMLRALSGVYKPFVKALKELVSNAFDADADHVHIINTTKVVEELETSRRQSSQEQARCEINQHAAS